MPVIAIDDYAASNQALDSPPRYFANVTPSDADDLVHVSRCFSFVTAGDLKVVTAGGQTLILPSGAFAAGIQHSGAFRKIFAAGTTALGIVVGW